MTYCMILMPRRGFIIEMLSKSVCRHNVCEFTADLRLPQTFFISTVTLQPFQNQLLFVLDHQITVQGFQFRLRQTLELKVCGYSLCH